MNSEPEEGGRAGEVANMDGEKDSEGQGKTGSGYFHTSASCFLLLGLKKTKSINILPSPPSDPPRIAAAIQRPNAATVYCDIRSARWWATVWEISWARTVARPSSFLHMGRIPLKFEVSFTGKTQKGKVSVT